MYFNDGALGRKRVASRGFVIGPGSVCHRARMRHCAWLMHKFCGQSVGIFVSDLGAACPPSYGITSEVEGVLPPPAGADSDLKLRRATACPPLEAWAATSVSRRELESRQSPGRFI